MNVALEPLEAATFDCYRRDGRGLLPIGRWTRGSDSKHIPGVEATAEVTTVSVDNMKLLHTGRVAIAFTHPDTAWEAHQGQLKGLREKVPVRTLAALYSNYLHIVALEGSGINGMSDLKGKRVSTGAPGSGTEIKGLRVMEAYGLSPKDLRSQRDSELANRPAP